MGTRALQLITQQMGKWSSGTLSLKVQVRLPLWHQLQLQVKRLLQITSQTHLFHAANCHAPSAMCLPFPSGSSPFLHRHQAVSQLQEELTH